MLAIILWIILAIVIIALLGLRVINQYENGVVLTLGKYTGNRKPGLTWVFWPFNIQKLIKVDLRIKAIDVPNQRAITKDNVSVEVNAVIYYNVKDAPKAVLDVEDYFHAMLQLAQSTMRDVVGSTELDEILSDRETISGHIQKIINDYAEKWGMIVDNVSLKDVSLPEDMESIIAKQAEAERKRRAVIIKAEGELAAAENLKKAAAILSSQTGGLHLRTLQSINDISSDSSNTVVFATPLEILKSFEGFMPK